MSSKIKEKPNKRRARTEELRNLIIQRDINELADNTIEQSRFDCLVRRGVIVIDET
jgi:hypothetical protein